MPPVQASLTSVDPTEPHFSTPLALPGIPSTSPVTHCRDQKASRDQQQQSRKLSKELATVSSARHPRSSNRRSAGTRKDSKSSSLCEICDKRFAQPQGLNRHRREKHAGKLARCIFCGVFEWNRLYILKEHLTRGHPELPVDIVTALIEATKARRRVIFTSRHSTR
ncbi:hypothetical protein BJV78DRAFT_753961 [Lactifluus subvellereus]|nr:hypothetical protein BJV78DRAFT_753961 [Lactifluus subvellereus]